MKQQTGGPGESTHQSHESQNQQTQQTQQTSTSTRSKVHSKPHSQQSPPASSSTPSQEIESPRTRRSKPLTSDTTKSHRYPKETNNSKSLGGDDDSEPSSSIANINHTTRSPRTWDDVPSQSRNWKSSSSKSSSSTSLSWEKVTEYPADRETSLRCSLGSSGGLATTGTSNKVSTGGSNPNLTIQHQPPKPTIRAVSQSLDDLQITDVVHENFSDDELEDSFQPQPQAQTGKGSGSAGTFTNKRHTTATSTANSHSKPPRHILGGGSNSSNSNAG
ncbi:hypothetical protein HK102_005655, partial [Quaeritorhiza haematococci]